MQAVRKRVVFEREAEVVELEAKKTRACLRGNLPGHPHSPVDLCVGNRVFLHGGRPVLRVTLCCDRFPIGRCGAGLWWNCLWRSLQGGWADRLQETSCKLAVWLARQAAISAYIPTACQRRIGPWRGHTPVNSDCSRATTGLLLGATIFVKRNGQQPSRLALLPFFFG